MYANMSPYCAMNNNPVNEVDPLGDSPAHVLAGIIGAGINVYNNWSSIVKNPWSAIGYAGTGALAGVVSLSPGGAAAAAKITAVGNLATDAISGNIPDIKSVEDAFNYGAKTVGNALDVGGSGKLAKAGLSGLASLGSEWAANSLEPFYETVYFNIVSVNGVTSDGISFSSIVSYDTKQVLRLGVPSLGVGKFSAGAVSGQLGASANGGFAPKHGGTAHNDRIDKWVRKVNKPGSGVSDIRKNQQQVDINGNKVGTNRPDLQFNKNGRHYNLEWDNSTRASARHRRVVTKNDPKAISKFFRLFK
jgi:hypothetical protein